MGKNKKPWCKLEVFPLNSFLVVFAESYGDRLEFFSDGDEANKAYESPQAYECYMSLKAGTGPEHPVVWYLVSRRAPKNPYQVDDPEWEFWVKRHPGAEIIL